LRDRIWAAASSQRTLYCVGTEVLHQLLYFKADGKGS